MIAIFATPARPTASRRPSQRGAVTRLLSFALALALVACGGLSVRHDENADSGADTAAAGKSSTTPAGNGTGTTHPATPDDPAACQTMCKSCLPGTSAATCSALCTTILADAAQAGCSAALSSLLACQTSAKSGCSTSACPNENNQLSVCVLEFCDTHVSSALCVEPL